MKSPYVSELQANQTVHGTFLVAHKDIRQKKSGEPYLSLILADRTGDLEAKMLDNASEALDTFERDNFVRVKGLLQIFQNRPQLVLHKIQPVARLEPTLDLGISERGWETSGVPTAPGGVADWAVSCGAEPWPPAGAAGGV